MIFESIGSFLTKVTLFSAYVKNNSSFEHPLSKEDEKLYFEKMKNGDLSAKNVLINHNLRLVAHIVKKYSQSAEADDLISVGSIGLIKAINSFDTEKGTLFSTYAARCIENEILMLLRSSKKYQNTISFEESSGQDKDGNEIRLMDIIPQSDDEGIENKVEGAILTEQIEQIMKRYLTPREYLVIKYRYGVNNTPAYTQREVASKLNISRSYISRIEKKAIYELQKHIKKSDIYSD
ncbi:MAG: RNA polymerase sporulation sigma factor SigK [Clostridia bacterium]|nr:RNA polymerase sporulation sigma factor SigK [Clostridia bacterium]